MNEPVPYERFRTGYTFCDVYYMIYNRPHKRRNGVLGYWRELKLKMYAEYLRQFEGVPDGVPQTDGIDVRRDA